MTTSKDTAGLFKKHLSNPSDPEPTLSLLRDSPQTAQFFDAFVASGEVISLRKVDKIQLLARLGVWCPADAPKLLEEWIALESDADLLPALQMRLRTFADGSEDPSNNV